MRGGEAERQKFGTGWSPFVRWPGKMCTKNTSVSLTTAEIKVWHIQRVDTWNNQLREVGEAGAAWNQKRWRAGQRRNNNSGKRFMLNCMGYKAITCSDPSFKSRFLIEGHIGQARVECKPSVQRLIAKPSRARIGTMGWETSWDWRLLWRRDAWLYQWIWDWEWEEGKIKGKWYIPALRACDG